MTLYGTPQPLVREPVVTLGQAQTFGPPWSMPAVLFDLFGGNLINRMLGVVPLGSPAVPGGRSRDLWGSFRDDPAAGVVPEAVVGETFATPFSPFEPVGSPGAGNPSHLAGPAPTIMQAMQALFPILAGTPTQAVTAEGRVNFIDPLIEAMPFGLVAVFRVRNDSNLPVTLVPRVRATSLQFRTERDRFGPRVELASGQQSAPIRITLTGLRQDCFEVELALLDEATGRPLNSFVQNVDLTVGRQPLGAAAGPAAAVSSIFTGSARFADGLNVPAGSLLTARVGGRRSGQVPIRVPGSFGLGSPSLIVRNSAAMAMAGDPVSFFLNSFQAVETAAYQPGGFPQRVSLTFPRT